MIFYELSVRHISCNAIHSSVSRGDSSRRQTDINCLLDLAGRKWSPLDPRSSTINPHGVTILVTIEMKMGRRRGRDSKGKGHGYATAKVGVCESADLKGIIFDYRIKPGKVGPDLMLMLTSQKALEQYFAVKFGYDIVSELRTKEKINIPAPKYSQEILDRHQARVKMAENAHQQRLRIRDSLIDQIDAAPDDSTLESQLDEIQLEIDGEELAAIQRKCYVELTTDEKSAYEDEWEIYGRQVQKQRLHRERVYCTILGQCTEELQAYMRLDPNWQTVHSSYDPIELYKLMERVILKQQHPIEAYIEQYTTLLTFKQGNLTNHEWFTRFYLRYDVAKLVGVEFKDKALLEYFAARDPYNSQYDLLTPTQQKEVRQATPQAV